MSDETTVPEKWAEKNPLMDDEGFEVLQGIRQHSSAPKWNFEVGDRVTAADLEVAKAYRARVFSEGSATGRGIPAWMEDWVSSLRERSILYGARLPKDLELPRDWSKVPTICREDLATQLTDIVPMDADLERLIAYDTSGTTGHAVDVPTHPETLASAHALAEIALDAYGIEPDFGPHRAACLTICAQQSTYIFANVFSVWNQAGFAKVNLREGDWAGGKEAARTFCEELNPFMITTDPVALSQMMVWDIPVKPEAIFSTAVALSPALKEEAVRHFGCPVIDWYSVTETGPIAFSAPDGRGMLTMAPDLYVEVVDEEGQPVADGAWGEIVVTGGRNPYLPLLRYRTGDRGRMEGGRLLEFEGRKAVYFRAADGSVVNPVDIARVLRARCPFVQHEFVQYADDSCELIVRPIPGLAVNQSLMVGLLKEVFGEEREIKVTIDETLGDDGKVIPYRNEME